MSSWKQRPVSEFNVLGFPVKHSWSPLIHNAALKFMGRTETYGALEVPPEELEEAIDWLGEQGVIGVNLTIPHKEQGFRVAQDTDLVSNKLGAVNTLRLQDRTAINTDVPGFQDSLVSLGTSPVGHALVLGAGGAGKAVIYALNEVGWKMDLWNRSQERAINLCTELGYSITVVQTLQAKNYSLIVNCTSSSIHDQILPIDWDNVSRDAIAYDLMYSLRPSSFMVSATTAGAKAVDGREMLIAQAARSLSWWLCIDVPIEFLRDALPK